MKRIPNKTAVITICWGINANQHVVIYDYETDYDRSNRKNGKLVVDGRLGDVMYDYRFCKYFESEYHGMTIDNGTVIFHVYTKFEEYK